ncbi:hypothetical protein FHU38_004900 [Saccharomonospora amisosensis]|uniref:Flagellar basal body-associated protein FliL n=1 Tax=Saccharomonospora amisosensis TaxID=1128677 RepID=A0A7X5ZT01_9PSEU|nr:flagellar basal body protein FliL [Saccharomonospora amisosensis]NIJ14499.1 hypothetical protein [Saccharomonospora amisosensis]
MSWQEELRKLDEELASGRLSADDYRVRRDQVLSSAVSQGEDPAASPEEQAQPTQQPPQGGQQEQGQQSQQQGEQQQDAGPTADSTQVISPVNAPADSSSERTQAVPQWQTQQPQYQQPQYQQPPQQHGMYSPAAGFQQPGPASPAGGFQQQPVSPAAGFQQPQPPQPQGPQGPQGPQQPQQPWNAPEQDQSPPWGGEFPPLAPSGSAQWTAQGPEGFDEGSGGGGKGKIFAIVGAVVVLAGIAVGAFLLWGQPDNEAAPQEQSTSQQQPTSSQAEPDPLPVGDVPGKAEDHSDVRDFSDVPDLSYLNSDELEAYERTSPGETRFAVHHLDNGNIALVLLTQVGDTAAAEEEVRSLADIQVDNGAEEVTENVPSGVAVTGYEPNGDGRSQWRAHYLSGDVLVRVEVSSEQGLDSARADFDEVLDAQTRALSADG